MKRLVLVLLVTLFYAFTMSTVRAGTITDTNIDIYNATTVIDDGNKSDPQELIRWAANYTVDLLLFVAGAAGIIMIGYSGVLYITAGGDDSKTSRAKRALVYAAISIIIASSSWLIRSATTRNTTRLQTDPDATVL